MCVHSQGEDGRLVDRVWSVGDQLKIEDADAAADRITKGGRRVQLRRTTRVTSHILSSGMTIRLN